MNKSKPHVLSPKLTLYVSGVGKEEVLTKLFQSTDPREIEQHFKWLLSGSGRTPPFDIKIEASGDRNRKLEGANITLNSNHPHLHVSYYINLYDKTTTLSEISFDKAMQSKGVARQLVAAIVDQSQRLGVQELEAIAGCPEFKDKKDVEMDMGGYAWAKYGFLPSQSSWDYVRREVKSRILTAKDIHDEGWQDDFKEFLATTDKDRYAIVTSDFSHDQREYVLTKKQYDLLMGKNGLLNKRDPKAIWVVSDLGVDIGEWQGKPISLGKVLLGGTRWENATLDIVHPNPSLDRLDAYLQPARERAKEAGRHF